MSTVTEGTIVVTTLTATNASASGTMHLSGAGSASAPALYINSDTDTGLYSVGADQLGIATGGTLRVTVADAAVTVANDLNVSGDINAAAGSATEPSLYFNSDTDTGLYQVSGNALGMTAGGTLISTVTSTGLTISSGVLLLPDGSNSAPSLRATNDADTGLYFSGVGAVDLTAAGTRTLIVDSVGVTVQAGVLLTQDGSAGGAGLAFANDTDTGIYRSANNTLDITAGSTRTLTVDSAGVTVQAGALRAANGTIAAPAISFTGQTGTGLASGDSNNRLHICESGNVILAATEGAPMLVGPAAQHTVSKSNFTAGNFGGATRQGTNDPRIPAPVRGDTGAYLSRTLAGTHSATSIQWDSTGLDGASELDDVADRFNGAWLALFNGITFVDYSQVSDHAVSGTTITLTVNFDVGTTPVNGYTVTIYLLEYAAPAINFLMPVGNLNDAGTGLGTSDTDICYQLSSGALSSLTDGAQSTTRVLIETNVNDMSATTTSFILDNADVDGGNDNIYVGLYLRMTSGANVGEIRRITSYAAVSATITCDAFGSAPSNGDTCQILRPDVVSMWFDKQVNAFRFAEYASDSVTGVAAQVGDYVNHSVIDGASFYAPTLYTRDPVTNQEVATKAYVDANGGGVTADQRFAFAIGLADSTSLVTGDSGLDRHGVGTMNIAHSAISAASDFTFTTDIVVAWGSMVGTGSGVAGNTSTALGSTFAVLTGAQYDSVVIPNTANTVFQCTVVVTLESDGTISLESGVHVVIYDDTEGATPSNDSNTFTSAAAVPLSSYQFHRTDGRGRATHTLHFPYPAQAGNRYIMVYVSRDNIDNTSETLTLVKEASYISVQRII